jgi:Rrf2 family transcriptional regulator, nitric oxide-sensitive transcriptional repressor
MVLSQTVEYALRAVVWLAQNPGVPQTTQAIAESTKVSASYLPKVLQPLIRIGIITGQRGLHGGYILEADPRSLTLLDVVNAVDPIQRITSCPLGIDDHKRLCPLHQKLDDAIAEVQCHLSDQTVAELLSQRGGAKPLCPSASAAVAVLATTGNGNGNGNGRNGH